MTNSRLLKTISVSLGLLTLISVGLLLVWDAAPRLFPTRAHDFLGALPLALIAITYLLYQAVQKPRTSELIKAVPLAAAFLLWAANQFWPDSQQATLLNDLAIALFVLDVFLVVIGWPSSSFPPE
jgi:hypothetical protein